ncbi:hypothetical protein A2U01_0014523, partial [Trifolium medium]|nr:hypothetical protein [Trifolium medium]
LSRKLLQEYKSSIADPNSLPQNTAPSNRSNNIGWSPEDGSYVGAASYDGGKRFRRKKRCNYGD